MKKREFKAAVARTNPTVFSAPERVRLSKYSDSEDRDEHGRWTSGAGSEPSSFQQGEHVRIASGRYDSGLTGHVVRGDPHKTGVAPASGGRQTFVAVRGGGETGYYKPEELDRHIGVSR